MGNGNILVTGAAGFIGYHLSSRLLKDGHAVVGVDNVNNYYDIRLKEERLKRLQENPQFSFERVDIAEHEALSRVFGEKNIRRVVNLAAQAGVRYSLQNPYAYTRANIDGFISVLECCRHAKVEHLVYASSSSVYGSHTKVPFSTHDNVDHPISLYAATKKANELMAHSYAHLFRIPCTGLRFFTVYGPWGRPDMALFSFTKAILAGQSIDVFNNGKMQRDFTYVDDIVEGISRLLDKPPAPDENWSPSAPDPATSFAPYKVYNIGNNQPVELLHFIEVLEKALGRKAEKRLLPMQDGDVPATYADVDDLMRDVGFRPATPIKEGIRRFVEWYRAYYKV